MAIKNASASVESADRANRCELAADLEAIARAALVKGSKTSEEGSAKRLQGALNKIKAETAHAKEPAGDVARNEAKQGTENRGVA